MAFTVEDGTGITGANALISVVEFNDFASDRGIDPTDYDIDVIQASIVVSSMDYINTFFVFKGESLTTTQGMQIPTSSVGVEPSIKQACYQATMLNLKGRLFVDPAELEVGGQVIKERDKVDTLEFEKEYADSRNYTFKFPTDSIDRLLQPFTLSGGGLGDVKRW